MTYFNPEVTEVLLRVRLSDAAKYGVMSYIPRQAFPCLNERQHSHIFCKCRDICGPLLLTYFFHRFFCMSQDIFTSNVGKMTERLHNTFNNSSGWETGSYQEKSKNTPEVRSTASSPGSCTTENTFSGVHMTFITAGFDSDS